MTTAQEESSSNEKAQKNDVYAKIDKLIAEISKNGPKTIDFHILKYFQKINYNSVRKKDIISIFTKEFTLNNNKFINYNYAFFESKNSFSYCLDKTLKQDLFTIFNQSKVKYVEVNPEKTLEYLNSLQKQILLEHGRNTVVKRKKDKIENEENSNKNALLNKKRKRHKLDNKNNNDKNEIKEENKLNNIKKVKNRKYSPNEDIEDNTTTEKIFNNNSFYLSHASKYTFNDKIILNNSAPLSNNSYFFESENYEDNNKPLSSKDFKEELFYFTKDEEEGFKILSQGIKPLEQKLNEINSFIKYKQQKLELVSNLLAEINQNVENYKAIKAEFNLNYNAITISYKCVEDQFKINKISEKMVALPFKDEINESHFNFIKNILKKSKSLFEQNDTIANKLNNYDIYFINSKISIENCLKEIIEGNEENKNNDDIIENLKSMLKSNFEEAFKKLNFENSNDNLDKEDNNNINDIKNIYEKNIETKNTLDTYVDKVKSFDIKK